MITEQKLPKRATKNTRCGENTKISIFPVALILLKNIVKIGYKKRPGLNLDMVQLGWVHSHHFEWLLSIFTENIHFPYEFDKMKTWPITYSDLFK